MIDIPKTLEEAKKYRFGQWAGNPKGMAYNEEQCAYGIYGTGYIEYQCRRKNGYGPDQLFCKQHAKMITKYEGTT